MTNINISKGPTRAAIAACCSPQSTSAFTDDDAATLAKVRKLMAGGMPGYARGMGAKRTIAAYWKFVDADPAAKVSKSEAKFCK